MFNDTPDSLHLMPGSFNPLHDGHRALMAEARRRAEFVSEVSTLDALAAYEISANRRGKESLTVDEILRRIEYFEDDDVVAFTNAVYFCQKAGSFVAGVINFHIGMDTAERLIEDDSIIGVQGINANFFVYPRGNKTIDFLEKIPNNMYEGQLEDKSHLFLSSTQIRQNMPA